MGLVKHLRDLFNKNIECGNEIDDHIVYLLKKKYLYLNKNIYVREKNVCVVVYKGRVSDVIYSGKYRINQESIPETFSKAKIEKKESKGQKIKRIRADVYFVNLEEFKKFNYLSSTPFKTKSSNLGKLKGLMMGECDVKVLDGKCIVKTLIAGVGKIKNKEIDHKMGLLIGNKINKLIIKNKIVADMMLNNQEYVEAILNTDMKDALDKEGLFVTNVKLKAVDFSKKYQSRVNRYLNQRRGQIRNIQIEGVCEKSNNVPLQVTSRVNGDNSIVHGAMQKHQNTTYNTQSFKECPKCRKKTSVNTKICLNCGNKLIN